LSSNAQRLHPEREKIIDENNIRQSYFHDTDRIIHSLCYSRYIDKTQVFYLIKNDHITHRVLHVQLVSKIARTIGRCLRLNEDLIEAVSLGHDLGHTPFGHDGEDHLNKICEKNNTGCFVHNAQSVRFLKDIENNGEGLNLTIQVYDGILCHNGELIQKEYFPVRNKTKEMFLEEYKSCFEDKTNSRKIIPMTLEGCVVRISDIIAYIGRDIEDAIKLNLIKRDQIPCNIVKILGNTNDRIIDNLIIDILNNSYDKGCIKFSEEVFDSLKKLINFNYENIYHNPLKMSQDKKIENMFMIVFEHVLNALETKNEKEHSYRWAIKGAGKEYYETTSKIRIAVDYISGMTDDFIIEEFERITMPQSFGFKFD